MIGLPNATITIPVVPTEPIGFDPYTSEPLFGTLTNKTVAVSLEEKNAPRELNLPGVDTAIAYLEGRISGTAPSELTANNFYDINITLQNQILVARFYVVATPSSRLGLDSVFGKAISGWLVK
jgi:hypothetical protein